MEADVVQDLLRALEEFGRAQREIGSRLARSMDLPRASIGVLRYLYTSGPVQIGCVAQHLRVDISVASRQVSALVAEGIVRRTVDDDDRRARTIELTDLGRTRVEEVREHITRLMAETFESWDPDDLRTSIHHMSMIARAIDAQDTDALAAQQG